MYYILLFFALLVDIYLYSLFIIYHQSMKGSSFLATSGDSVSESGYSVKFEVSPGLLICGKKGAGIFF